MSTNQSYDTIAPIDLLNAVNTQLEEDHLLEMGGYAVNASSPAFRA
jgi:hypothetical protein